MTKTIFNLSLILALGACSGCLAADKTAKPTNDLKSDASNAMNALGKGATQVEHAITTSVTNLQKGNGKNDNHPKPNNDLEQNASNALHVIGHEADKAEHEITGAVRSVGKNSSGTNKDMTNKNSSKAASNNVLSDFGKNANKTGAAIETSMKNMGNQAGKQLGQAERAINKNMSDNHSRAKVVSPGK